MASLQYGVIIPRMQAVPNGGDIEIVCLSKSIPKWTFSEIRGDKPKQNIILPEYTHSNGKLLLIPKASENNHNGIFTCIGTDENDSPLILYSEALIGSTLFKYA